MEILTIPCGSLQTNAYRVDGMLWIDPGDALLPGSGDTSAEAVLLTHGHFDHMLSALPIAKRFGCPVFCGAEDHPMLSDPEAASYGLSPCTLPFPDGLEAEPYPEELFGFRVLRTPGHTPGSVCLYHAGEGILFSGDTLFRAGFGRTDLPGGSMHALLSSLRMLFTLPEETRVLPGHGGPTTIGEERRRYAR